MFATLADAMKTTNVKVIFLQCTINEGFGVDNATLDVTIILITFKDI